MEDLVSKAGMTRARSTISNRDKRDLFRAVFEAVEIELGQRIAREVAAETDPWSSSGRGTCLPRVRPRPCDPTHRLVDGPSVLGWEECGGSTASTRSAWCARCSRSTSRPATSAQPAEPLAHLIVGALNEAALAVAAADDPTAARDEFAASMDGVLEALRAAARAARPSAHQ